jgi:hypothetical protein
VLPPVTNVISVEMIRDGGSLAVVFGGSDSAEYWLFFPVRTESVDADHTRIAGWGAPEIHERRTGLTTEISWQHAKTFIVQLKPHVRDPREVALLDAMIDIASAGGGITPSVKAVYPSIGEPRHAFYPPKRAS